jgi:hypothetical protein
MTGSTGRPARVKSDVAGSSVPTTRRRFEIGQTKTLDAHPRSPGLCASIVRSASRRLRLSTTTVTGDAHLENQSRITGPSEAGDLQDGPIAATERGEPHAGTSYFVFLTRSLRAFATVNRRRSWRGS